MCIFLNAFITVYNVYELELSAMKKEAEKQKKVISAVTNAKNQAILHYLEENQELNRLIETFNDSLTFYTSLVEENTYTDEEYQKLEKQKDSYKKEIRSLKSRLKKSESIVKAFEYPLSSSGLYSFSNELSPAAVQFSNEKIPYINLPVLLNDDVYFAPRTKNLREFDGTLYFEQFSGQSNVQSDFWVDDIATTNGIQQLPIGSIIDKGGVLNFSTNTNNDIFFIPQNENYKVFEGTLYLDTSLRVITTPIFNHDVTPSMTNPLYIDQTSQSPGYITVLGDSNLNIGKNPNLIITPK